MNAGIKIDLIKKLRSMPIEAELITIPDGTGTDRIKFSVNTRIGLKAAKDMVEEIEREVRKEIDHENKKEMLISQIPIGKYFRIPVRADFGRCRRVAIRGESRPLFVREDGHIDWFSSSVVIGQLVD